MVMMFDQPDFDTLYKALVARDETLDGQFFVGVKTTGIFCRMTCPARKPKPENCEFFDTVSTPLSAGYRPCKRCHPLAANHVTDPVIKDLVARLMADPARRWRETDVQQLGYDPSTVRRQFKRVYGMTFLEMARQLRLRLGFETLASGQQVIEAQLDAGFESASGFRDAFARLLGVPPGSLKGDRLLKASWLDTPLGNMIIVTDTHHLHLLEFVGRKGLAAELKRLNSHNPGGVGIGRTPITELAEQQLSEYFSGTRNSFSVPLALAGSDFTKKVWRALQKIPAGETRSYADVARMVGNPNAIRAVARANGANELAIIIPCHRVIGSDGSLTGYAGGLWRKEKLIKLEAQYR